MSIQISDDNLDNILVYYSESIALIVDKEIDLMSINGISDINISKDLVSLRFYKTLIEQFKLYKLSNDEEPEWDVNQVIEKGFEIINKYLKTSYQWSQY